MTSTQADDSYS